MHWLPRLRFRSDRCGMKMRWIDTTTEDQVVRRDEALWEPVWTPTETGIEGHTPGPCEDGGEFWYETLQRSKDDPRMRYEIAERHLPLPAAWREMAIALRAMIRQARKDGADAELALRKLHGLAALWSFAVETDADKGIGYGLFEMTPYSRFAGLDLSWERIGCDELVLLNPTDRKWMRAAWGEPPVHSTAKRLHSELYLAVSARVRELNAVERERRHADAMARIDEMLREDEPAAVAPAEPATRPGLFARIFAR